MNKLEEKAKQLILQNKKASILLYSHIGMGTRYLMWKMINSLYENPQRPQDKLSILLNEPIVIEYICTSKVLKDQIEKQIEGHCDNFLQKYIKVKSSPVSKIGDLIAHSTADLLILDEVHRKSLDFLDTLQRQRENSKGTSIIVIEGTHFKLSQGFDYVIKLPEPNLSIAE